MKRKMTKINRDHVEAEHNGLAKILIDEAHVADNVDGVEHAGLTNVCSGGWE